MYPSEINPIILDIETTGLTADSKITAIGLYYNGEFTIIMNGYSDIASSLSIANTIATHSDVPDSPIVEPIECSSEEQLLEKLLFALKQIATETEDVVTMFRGYRTYQSGFDYPMIQTRAHANSVANPLKECSIWDVSETIENVSILERESLTVEDAFAGRGGLNKSYVVEFADELESFYRSYLTDQYDSEEITAVEETIQELSDPTPAEILSQRETPLSQRELAGLLESDWTSGSRKSDIIDSLDVIEPIFEIPTVRAFILDWFDENDFTIPTAKQESLEDIYTVLKELEGENPDSIDPLEDSSEAIEAYENENYTDLIAHLCNDLIMTSYLAQFAIKSSVHSDFHIKTV